MNLQSSRIKNSIATALKRAGLVVTSEDAGLYAEQIMQYLINDKVLPVNPEAEQVRRDRFMEIALHEIVASGRNPLLPSIPDDIKDLMDVMLKTSALEVK